MKKTITFLSLVLALSGCATIEKRLASYIISRYVGIWQKPGGTDDDRSIDSNHCIWPSLGTDGVLDETKYRACMTEHGWVLTPVEIQ